MVVRYETAVAEEEEEEEEDRQEEEEGEEGEEGADANDHARFYSLINGYKRA